MTEAKYLALDIETTGLDPMRDRIIEIAAIAVTEDFEEVDVLHSLINMPGTGFECENANKVVRDMHEASGLFAELKALKDYIVPHEVETWLIDFIITYFEEKPILLGNSVHFDHSFLKVWMPEFERRLSHRHLDCSTLLMFAPELRKRKDTTAHRAIADARESLEVARKFRAAMRGWGDGVTRYQKYNDLNSQALHHDVCETCRDKAFFRAGAEAMRAALKGLYEDTDLTIDFILGEEEAVSTDDLWYKCKKGDR